MDYELCKYKDQETVITAENLNAIQDELIEQGNSLKNSAVACPAKGESIVITDSSSNRLLGLSLYGKSTQAGTPTPSAPVDIVSVGGDDSIDCHIYGKSIVGFAEQKSLTYNGITYTINDDGSVTANGTATGDANLNIGEYNNWYLPKGKYKFSTGVKSSSLVLIVGAKDNENVPYVYGHNEVEFECKNSGKENGHCLIQIRTGVTVSNLTFYPMVRAISADSSFERVKTPQTISIDTTNGLKAVPVTNKANATYTDENGKMWCADEIDLEKGVRVQRVYKYVLEKSPSIGYKALDTHMRASINFSNKYSIATPNGMSNILEMVGDYTANTPHFYVQNTQLWVFIPLDELATADANGVIAWLTDKGAEFYYALANPIVTELNDTELEAYKSLRTNNPNTTILNDSGAYMSVKYQADAKSYIDNKVASAILAATLE